jgi:hypothetical protein
MLTSAVSSRPSLALRDPLVRPCKNSRGLVYVASLASTATISNRHDEDRSLVVGVAASLARAPRKPVHSFGVWLYVLIYSFQRRRKERTYVPNQVIPTAQCYSTHEYITTAIHTPRRPSPNRSAAILYYVRPG